MAAVIAREVRDGETAAVGAPPPPPPPPARRLPPRAPPPRPAGHRDHHQSRGLLALSQRLQGVLRLRPAGEVRPVLPLGRPDRPVRQPESDRDRRPRPSGHPPPGRRRLRHALLPRPPGGPLPRRP